MLISPSAVLAQEPGAISSSDKDTSKVEIPNLSKTKPGTEKELFPQMEGREVLEIKVDSNYSNGLNPKEAKDISKPKNKKGVIISSKDCPVT
ncbi:MAG: hypothetical protein COB85_06210 [Bacteroidetes bacterium]|nr:MAG: hypothetical protein COB85_06210 [Bacteroidota bacterium]